MRVSLTDRRADLDHNLVGTINVLESMIENKIPDFVFASTSAIYGEDSVTPTPENYFGTQTSLYGAAKLACVTGRAKVLTESGSKKISAIKVGDLVYTHKNNLRRVMKTFKRLYDGELVRIRLGSRGGNAFINFKDPLIQSCLPIAWSPPLPSTLF